jgi:hypothetical protein
MSKEQKISASVQQANELLYPSQSKNYKEVKEKKAPGLPPAEIQQNLYPNFEIHKPKIRFEAKAINNISILEQTSRKKELNDFIKAIKIEFPKQKDGFSKPFTYLQLLERFRDYRNVSDDKLLFEKFSVYKIMRLLQKLYHANIVNIDSQSPKSYKIDYNKIQNPHINNPIF